MKINSITLKNIGSYQGENSFNTTTDKDHNIVLIGGKNGAGKTTLFNSVKICLYGYASMGYKSKNYYYYKTISQLINDSAKLSNPNEAFIEINISLIEGNNENTYILTRRWKITDNITEDFSVTKNNSHLTKTEIGDFEKYIINLIPPELFNLYFFDGERILEYFMSEDSPSKIKNAFLTLCGYDTFDIMKKNFKRVNTNKQDDSELLLTQYLDSKQSFQKIKTEYDNLQKKLEEYSIALVNIDSLLQKNQEEYLNNGGMSDAERNKLAFEIKQEELNRSNWNQKIKHLANTRVPFFIIKKLLGKLKEQIAEEQNAHKIIAFKELIKDDGLHRELSEKLNSDSNKIIEIITNYITKHNPTNNNIFLNLSDEQSMQLNNLIGTLIDFDSATILNLKENIAQSKQRSTSIRNKLESSNQAITDIYLNKKQELLSEKDRILAKQSEIQTQINKVTLELPKQEKEYLRTEKELKISLKNKSMANIAAKSILMLEDLETTLYHNQIIKIEDNFRNIINKLTYKKKFIDDIYIDDGFNIHLYKIHNLDFQKIKEIIEVSGISGIETTLGIKAKEKILSYFKTDDENLILDAIDKSHRNIEIPLEINKNILSSGEKQIFIMALYFSMVTMNSKQLPFIIDTPFARIDMDNRINLTENFFMKLKGQVFILSTDKEIEDKHMALLKDKLSTTYTLKNDSNKQTIIFENQYFEVNHDI